jgi:hypothetical protein
MVLKENHWYRVCCPESTRSIHEQPLKMLIVIVSPYWSMARNPFYPLSCSSDMRLNAPDNLRRNI